MGLLEGGDALVEVVVREAIGLGAYDQVGALGLLEELDELGIACPVGGCWCRRGRCRGRVALAFCDVGLDEEGPLGGDGLRDLGIAVAGEVGEDEGGF